MIKHVVLFKLKKENYEADLAEGAAMLKALPEKIDTISTFEVGCNIRKGEEAYSLALVSTFEDQEKLDAYAVHPEHRKFVEFIVPRTESIAEMDYLI